MKYFEYAIGGLVNRNQIIEADKFSLNGQRSECYKSMFYFDDGLKIYVDKTKSVSGYSGQHCSDYLYFDFDGSDLHEVKAEVEKFIRFLEVEYMPIEYVSIFFSGNKGFHLSIPFKAISEPEFSIEFYKTVKKMVLKLTAGFKFVDAGIYQINRLMRLENTINAKSGLYKIPITFEELVSLSVAEIQEVAKTPREFEQYEDEIKEISGLRELYLECKRVETEPKQSNVNEFTNILQGVAEGNRNNAAVKLAGLFVAKGFDETLTLVMLKLWNQNNNPKLSENEIQGIVRSCFRYKKVDAIPVVYSIGSGFNEYKQFVSTFDAVKVKLGFEPIDEKIRGLVPGEVAVILGRTSVGKSAFLQWIGLNYAKRTKQPVLFFSLEMPISSVIERSIQISTGECGYDVERFIKSGNVNFEQEVKAELQKIQSFYSVTKSGLNLEQIKNIIQHSEENIFKQKCGLILIDYLGLIAGGGRDLYEKTSNIAREIKTIAKDINTPIIYLSQINRKYQGTDELDISAARDSGAVEEAADFVFGLRRVDAEDTEDSIKLELGVLKNRRGSTGKIEIYMNKKSLNFTTDGKPF
ncbi:MAG: DnaB-like helicase C-terminal domain-containing protein [Bacteroidota bacterium]|nr:DnaB-like helicase C-terminal domain-containing protein [Bacteroidota bacterium]